MSSFDDHADLLKAYQAAYPDVTPSLGVLVGTGMATLMNQVLDAACDNGDLTRAGVLDAFNDLKDVDTGGLVVPIRGFENGKSPSLESFVLQPADAPGGAKVLAGRVRGRVRGEDRRLTPRRRTTAPPPRREGRRRAVLEPAAPGDRQQPQREHGGERRRRPPAASPGRRARASTAMRNGTAKPR